MMPKPGFEPGSFPQRPKVLGRNDGFSGEMFCRLNYSGSVEKVKALKPLLFPEFLYRTLKKGILHI
jgi:hypothetical protein